MLVQGLMSTAHVCEVTVGTTSFDDLVKEVDSPSFQEQATGRGHLRAETGHNRVTGELLPDQLLGESAGLQPPGGAAWSWYLQAQAAPVQHENDRKWLCCYALWLFFQTPVICFDLVITGAG